MILCIGFGLPFLHSSRQLFLLLQKWQKLHFCRNTKNKSSQKKGNDPNSFLMHTLCVLWVNFNVPQFQISCSRNRKQVRGYQQKFRVNVWAGIVGDYLIGLYVLPPRLNAQSYLVFLRDVLPELLEEQLPILLLSSHWLFQHDGCPALTTVSMCEDSWTKLTQTAGLGEAAQSIGQPDPRISHL